jgi:tetratricopeptide (TPR) repeat protein
MKCPVCDNAVIKGANFCLYCGTPLDRVSTSKSSVAYVYIGFRPRTGPSFPKKNEELAAALKNAEKICRRYKGVVEKETASNIIVEFKDSSVGQASAELAAYAGLEIKDYYRKKTSSKRDKTGLSVFIGIDGAEFITVETKTEIGVDEPSAISAKRLSAKSPPNAILTSGFIAEKIKRSFISKPLGFYKIRTHTYPLRLFELLGAKPARSAVSNGTAERRVNGRDKEISILKRHLDETKKNRNHSFAAISGESGYGKTELLQHITEDAANNGWQVVFAQGQDVSRFAPYYLWRSVYEKLRSALEGSIPADEFVLSAVRGDPTKLTGELLKPEDIRTYIEDFFCNVVDYYASEVPTLIAVDDVHLSDYASISILNRLLEETPKTVLAVVASSRKEIRSVRYPYLEIELGEFDGKTAKGIVEYFVEKYGLDRPTVENLYKHSNGNPLVLDWLVKYTVSKPGEIPGITDSYRPFDIPELVKDRIDALDMGSLDLLEFQYNAGGAFPVADLRRAAETYLGTESTRLDDRIKWLTEFNLATMYGDSYGKYLGLTGYCRDSLNTRETDTVGSAGDRSIRFLEEGRGGNDVLIGRCFLRYGDSERAFDYFINAGKHALALGAELDAQGLFSTAIEIADSDRYGGPPEKIASVYNHRADALRKLGLSGSVLTDIKTAVERYGNERVPPELRLDYAEILTDSKNFAETLENASSAVETLGPDDDPGVRIRGLELIGDVRLNTGQLSEAVESYEEALLAEPSQERITVLLRKTGLAKTMACLINEGAKDLLASYETASDAARAAAAIPLVTVLTDKGQFTRALSTVENALTELEEPNAYDFQSDVYQRNALELMSVPPFGFSPPITEKVLLITYCINGADFNPLGDYLSGVRAYTKGDPDEFNDVSNQNGFSGDGFSHRITLGAKFLLNADFELHYNEDSSSAGFYAKSALRIFEGLKLPYYVAECRLRLAEAATGRGDCLTARNELDAGVVRKKKRVSYPYLANYNRVFGSILVLEGSVERGSRFINSAAILYKSYGMVIQEALCYAALAEVSDKCKASEYYSKAIWLSENGGGHGWAGKYANLKKEKRLSGRSRQVL